VSTVAAPPRAAGPLDEAEAATLPQPPLIRMGGMKHLSGIKQLLRFNQRQIEFVFGARRRLGPVFALRTPEPHPLVVTSLPDDVRSLFTAKPEEAPSMAAESPLRPIVGPDSVLTSLGERHMRQRKLLLPPFHGEAIERYTQAIAEATEREIDTWPLNRPFALAPHMQAITLDVIMAGIFGIEGRPAKGTPERHLRTVTKNLVAVSSKPIAQLAELMNVRREEPVGFTRAGVKLIDRPIYAVIEQRRRAGDLDERRDILSLLLQARTEEGEELTDYEIRSELLTLVLAGHETTANSLAWAWERLVRNPEAQERLVESVRSGDEDAGAEAIEATARRLDLVAEDPAPERALHRNVTMIPARGGRVIARSRHG
jgi:cytochrome P450